MKTFNRKPQPPIVAFPSGRLSSTPPPAPIARPKSAIRDPPGFVSTLSKASTQLPVSLMPRNLMLTPVGLQASSKNATSLIPSAPDLSALRAQKAWDLALGPAKNVPMQGEQPLQEPAHCRGPPAWQFRRGADDRLALAFGRSVHDVHDRRRDPDLLRHVRSFPPQGSHSGNV